MFLKFLSLEKRKRNILQHLGFRGVRECFLQNLEFDNRLRNENSILQLELREEKWFISSQDFLEIETLVNACLGDQTDRGDNTVKHEKLTISSFGE